MTFTSISRELQAWSKDGLHGHCDPLV